MVSAQDGYDWEEILERLDLNWGDFNDMPGLINALHGVLQRMPSQLQIDMTVKATQTQAQRAADLGIRIERFERRGQIVTALRDPRGRFVAETRIPRGAVSSSQRSGAGSITAALRRGAG